MSAFLFIYVTSLSQVLPLCNKQSECQIGYYCGDTNLCYTCSYISPGDCDVLNTDCCSHDFLQQCKDNPYQCTLPRNPSTPESTNSFSFMFNLILGLSFINYVAIGSYRNKYIHRKEGIEIFPNYNFWLSVKGLVKDGIQFTCNTWFYKNNYDSLE